MSAIQTVELKTARLSIVSPMLELAPSIVTYVQSNRDHLKPWSPPRPSDFETIEYWQRRLQGLAKEFSDGASACFTLLSKEAPIEVLGECNITGIMRGPFLSCYLGFNLDRRVVGRGMMQEALRAVIPFVFDVLKLHRISANYIPTNLRSENTLRALGFTVEGHAKDYLYIDGRWHDHVLTSLINPDTLVPLPTR